MQQTVLITGGTGTIGKTLVPLLVANGYKCVLLTRYPEKYKSTAQIQYAHWNVTAQTIDNNAVAAADYIIHMAGAGVADERWTEARKKEIADSRTQSSTLLIKALQNTPHQVKAFISASAIGWYGPDTTDSLQAGFTEKAPAFNDYLGTTCLAWEQSVAPAESLGIRLVKLRIGIVLSNDGGALVEFKKPLMGGIAAIMSNGQQMVSWIHVTDLANMYLYALKNEQLFGSYNAVAPEPVSNKTLTLTLAKAVRGNLFIPIHVPAFVLKLILGEMSIEVLKSTTVSSKLIQQKGFQFNYTNITNAIAALTGK
jgi:uncharacterized protein (TIGR01777 family)